MSIEFAVSHIEWNEFEAALTYGYISRPFWKNQFAVEDIEMSCGGDNEISSALTATESYIQLRPHLPDSQRIALDEIVGGLMWNYDYPIPNQPRFTARTNACDVDLLRDAAQSLLDPESVKRMLVAYDQVNFDSVREIADKTLTEETLDTFETPSGFIDYVCQWRNSLRRAASKGYGFFTYLATSQP
jgi:hypothetical protein